MNEKILLKEITSITKDDRMTKRIMSLLFPQSSDYRYLRCDHGHIYTIYNEICNHCIHDGLVDLKEILGFDLDDFCDEDCDDDLVIVDNNDPIEKCKNDKVKEIQDSLLYLKTNDFKTKKDKESIYTLETVLKNFS
jgi:hypothetical protein